MTNTASDPNVRTYVEHFRKLAGNHGLSVDVVYDATETVVHIPSPSDRYSVDIHVPAPEQPGGLHLRVWERGVVRPRIVPFLYLDDVLSDLAQS